MIHTLPRSFNATVVKQRRHILPHLRQVWGWITKPLRFQTCQNWNRIFGPLGGWSFHGQATSQRQIGFNTLLWEAAKLELRLCVHVLEVRPRYPTRDRNWGSLHCTRVWKFQATTLWCGGGHKYMCLFLAGPDSSGGLNLSGGSQPIRGFLHSTNQGWRWKKR